METNEKMALVSGANRGIGQAITAGLAREGVHVLMGCRSLDKGEAAAAPLIAEGFKVTPVVLDVTSQDSVDALVKQITGTWGRIDILVNNAGVGLDFVPDMTTVEKMDATLQINVLGTLRLTEAMLPLLGNSDAPRIVNVSSELASFSLRHTDDWEYKDFALPTYAASKAALNALTVSYAKTLADKGIKVNAICPGFTATEATNFMPDRTTEQAAQIVLKMALIDNDGPTGTFTNDAGTIAW